MSHEESRQPRMEAREPRYPTRAGDALLLPTKLAPPVLHDARLPRERLVRRLMRADGLSLARITAPTGFGKTGLVHEWAVADVRRTFCWLSLDRTDDHPERLWGYITESLCRGEPRLREPLAEALPRGHAGLIEDRLIPALVSAVLAVGRPLVLVLDDAHLLGGAETWAGIDYLLRRSPPQLQTVLVGRAGRPPSRLGLMRIRGEALELGADDLRFDPAETRRYLLGHQGLELDERQIDGFTALCEGWPAAVRLATVQLRRGRPPDEVLAALHSAPRDVADYLRAEMLEAIPPERRALLREASMLREISAPLLDAVAGSSGAAELLDDLGDVSAFVPPLRERPGWHRMHSLLADVLRREQRDQGEESVRALHSRASAWHEEHGSSVRAIEHAIAAGDGHRAAALLRGAWAPFTWGDSGQLLRWIDLLPSPMRESDAVIALAAGWASGDAGRGAEMQRWLALAEAAPGFGDLVIDGMDAATVAEIGRALLLRDDVRERSRAARAVAAAQPEGLTLAVLARAALGAARYHLGLVHRARLDLEHALPRIHWGWAEGVARSTQGYLALCLLELGEVDAAAEMARRARAGGAGTPLAHPDVSGLGLMATGAVLHARGEHAAARRALQDAAEKLARAGDRMLGAEALLRLSAAAEAGGDREAARAAVSGALALVRPCPDPGRLRARIADAAARLGVEAPPAAPHGGGEPLSAREREILGLLADGLSRREAGARLYLSFNTIATHTRAIYRKLGVGTREEAVARARERGLLDAPPARE